MRVMAMGFPLLLLRAAETLLGPVGWPAARLQSWLVTP